MSGFIQSGRFGGGGGVGGHLDTQNVTTGTAGSAGAQDRIRGYDATGPIGSISDGTSNIFGPGNAITSLEYYEGGGGTAQYILTIAGATDSGWTTMTINGPNGTVVLTRTARTSFSANTWYWDTAHTIPTQAFGPASSAITIDFD